MVIILAFLSISLAAQVNDDYFVHNPPQQPNDWENFFKTGALSELRDQFIGRCSRISVNPSLVLVLMDTQSGILTNKSVIDTTKPFGESLSNKTGFLNQMDDVLLKLANTYHSALEQQKHEFSNTTQKLMKVRKTAATQALEQLFIGVGLSPEEQLQKLYDNHQTLFHRPISTPQDKAFYAASSKVQQLSTCPPPMQLPWQRNTIWSGGSGGTHATTGRKNDRPFDSIDFFEATSPKWGNKKHGSWVHASHAGTVSITTGSITGRPCQVRIVHPSGWSTWYTHLDGIIVSKNQAVQPNDRLGRVAYTKNQAICNGGHSTAPHLHWTLWDPDGARLVNTLELSNYMLTAGSFQYDHDNTYWKKGQTKVNTRKPMTAYQPIDNYRITATRIQDTACSTGYRAMTKQECHNYRSDKQIGSFFSTLRNSSERKGCYQKNGNVYFNTAGKYNTRSGRMICINKIWCPLQ